MGCGERVAGEEGESRRKGTWGGGEEGLEETGSILLYCIIFIVSSGERIAHS